MILGDDPARLDPAIVGAEAVDAGTKPKTGRRPRLRVVTDEGCRQASVPVAGGDRLEQVLVATPGTHHTHRDRHAGQVRRGYLVVQEVWTGRGLHARTTFRSGKLCANFPVWKSTRGVRCLTARRESSYGPPVGHTTHRFVVRRSRRG